MRLTLDRALFDVRSPAEATALLDLLVTAHRHAPDHAILTSPLYTPGGSNGELDVWLAQSNVGAANAFRALFSTSLVSAAGTRTKPSAAPGPTRAWCLGGSLAFDVERGATDWANRKLTPSDAASLLREPLHLILENDRTDLEFLCHLAGSTHGAALRAALDQPGRVDTHGGGTGEAKRWLEALVAGPPTAATWRRFLRAWVLFDRDSGEIDARDVSESASQLIKSCEDVARHFGTDLSWVCLGRRELESYIPDAGLDLEALATQAAFVKEVIAWRGSPALERSAWALDLKKGLLGDLRSTMTEADRKNVRSGALALGAPMLKEPFNALSASQISILRQGLGKSRLSDALLRAPPPAWTANIPAEYDRGPAAPNQAPRAALVQSLFDRM